MTAVPTNAGRAWLLHALVTVVLWGIWGAFSGLPPQYGFPETLVYCVWSLTSRRAILYGAAIGFLGAGGQLVLFYTVTQGPAYFVFPIISLSPVVTIAMSFFLLRERTGRLGALGILLALIALPMFDFLPQAGDPAGGSDWFPLALIVMACWGVQAYFMKAANEFMSAESIFFYMMLTGLALAPVALAMTDFGRPINLGASGPWLAAGTQLLNAIGALTLVFAFRYGKAIVVAPLSNAGAPLVTAVISLIFVGVVPGPLKLAGLALALVAAVLLAIEPDTVDEEAVEHDQEPSTPATV
jgi:drug/metabolite transporter (DMT)-like permease